MTTFGTSFGLVFETLGAMIDFSYKTCNLSGYLREFTKVVSDYL